MEGKFENIVGTSVDVANALNMLMKNRYVKVVGTTGTNANFIATIYTKERKKDNRQPVKK